MPKDPLLNSTPDQGRELFVAFSTISNGAPHDVVITAAANILLNSIRQEHPSWLKAEPAWDELFGKLKTILKAHYGSTGARRNIFPFSQNIEPPVFRNQQKFTLKPNGGG